MTPTSQFTNHRLGGGMGPTAALDGGDLDAEFELAAAAVRLLGSRYFLNAVASHEKEDLAIGISEYLDQVKRRISLGWLRVSVYFDLDDFFASQAKLKILIASHAERTLDYEKSCHCPRCELDFGRPASSVDISFVCERCGWQKDPRYQVQNWGKAGCCPQCGFKHMWDGQLCGYCKHPEDSLLVKPGTEA
jgi:hypothetical protein